jgi:hypothetical protein
MRVNPADLAPEGRDRTRRALGALTAWADTVDENEEYPLLLRYIAAEGSDVEATMSLVLGYNNLAADLLTRLEEATGKPLHDIGAELAGTVVVRG